MSKTDSIKDNEMPAIILVNPQMGENIGAAARAMLNCGLTDLRLVNPRDGWPSKAAEANSSGALEIMPPVSVFDSTAAAIADCHHVYATTARRRDMTMPVMTAKAAAEDIHKREAKGQKIGILFGGERAGLDNDDVALAHTVVTVPLNPDFTSLNLAQGVLLLAYEYFQFQDDTPAARSHLDDEAPVTHELLHELFERLESELETHHFFRNDGQKPIMIRNLRNMLSRAEMTDQEARTFHGVISALIGKKAPLQD